MKKLTFILTLILIVSVNFDSFAAYSKISAVSFDGGTDYNETTVTIPSGVYGTFNLSASVSARLGGSYGSSYAKITGINFSRLTSAYAENNDTQGHKYVPGSNDSNLLSGTVGSSACSLTYTIIAYAKTQGYSHAGSTASVTW